MARNQILEQPFRKLVVLTALAGLVLAGAAVRPAPAKAASPCWKQLLNDWYDGRIDQTYPVHCYRDALKHLPADVQTYSSAHDDILRALQSAIAKGKSQNTPVGGDTPVPPQTKTTAGAGGTETTGTTTTTGSTGGGTEGRQDGDGLAGAVDSSSPSSVPVPLIVLGALALLLVAAGGAGLLWKRRQDRQPGV
jgi:hypothetical protein